MISDNPFLHYINNMKIYRLTKPDNYKGLFKVSLVDEPAIQSNLMAFSDEKSDFTFKDEEKRIIYSAALIPNKLIFRKNINGEAAQVYFDADTIKDLQIDYFRKNGNAATNLNHQAFDTPGVFSFENWIVEDSVQDKAFKMGFDVPVGTMMMGYKIDNQDVWNEIKSGNLKGLSIEAQLFPEEQKVNFKKEDMNKKSMWAKAIELFKTEFKFADMTDYGNGYFGSSLEMGAIITDADGNPMPEATFTFENKVYETDEMGAIDSIEDAKVEDSEDAGGDSTELADAQAKITELETTIADLQAQLTEATATKMANEETAKKELEDIKAENVKLAADLVNAMKIKNNPPPEVKKPYEQMTNAEKVKFNRENKY